MKLQKLLKDLKGLDIRGPKDIEITGISSRSDLIAPGNLFIAKKGKKFDGTEFIPDAISSGAAAVLTDLYNPFIKDTTQLIHPNIVEMEYKIAGAFYNNPHTSLFLTGITGTNGKTATTYLIKSLLEPCGLMGTIEHIIGDHRLPTQLTTPDLITIYKLLYEMVQNRCTSGVMEVSSHALHQQRCQGISYDVAIFTNLTQDHLDYHQTMEAYAAAKSLLFKQIKEGGHALINADDSFASKMIEECQSKVFTYGIDQVADFNPYNLKLSRSGIQFELHFQNQLLKIKSPLVGRFNVYNLLAAIATACIKGVSPDEIAAKISRVSKIPGRLERVENSNVFVDYAHTPDALEKVLQTLNELKKGQLILVFGCGGDRDKEKRPLMGNVASQGADHIIITSDNPRNESPQSICQEVAQGCGKRHEIEIDREKAISKAIRMAGEKDMILIAGKGHETVQIFHNRMLPFDDRVIALKTLEKLSQPQL